MYKKILFLILILIFLPRISINPNLQVPYNNLEKTNFLNVVSTTTEDPKHYEHYFNVKMGTTYKWRAVLSEEIINQVNKIIYEIELRPITISNAPATQINILECNYMIKIISNQSFYLTWSWDYVSRFDVLWEHNYLTHSNNTILQFIHSFSSLPYLAFSFIIPVDDYFWESNDFKTNNYVWDLAGNNFVNFTKNSESFFPPPETKIEIFGSINKKTGLLEIFEKTIRENFHNGSSRLVNLKIKNLNDKENHLFEEILIYSSFGLMIATLIVIGIRRRTFQTK